MIKYRVEINDDKTIRWYKWDTNEHHREDGPAIEYADGSKWWCLNGKLHREDGPAIEYANGTKHWYRNGKCLTEKQWKAKVNPTSHEGKTVEIDGVKYELRKPK